MQCCCCLCVQSVPEDNQEAEDDAQDAVEGLPDEEALEGEDDADAALEAAKGSEQTTDVLQARC